MNALVLTLDQSGNPLRWNTWEDAVTARCKDLIAWELGDMTAHFGGTNRLTGERSTVAVPSIMAIKGTFKKVRKVVVLNNKALFGRDRCTCGYCGKVFPQGQLTRDHIIPVSRNGANTFMNCVTACKSCNNRKDDKLLHEAGMSLLYVPYVPCHNEALILANRHIIGDQMSYLAAKLPSHSRVLLS